MAGDVNHVIHPAGDPIVAVLVSAAAVSSKEHTRVEREVGLDDALVIAIDGPHHPWPGKLETQVASNTVPAPLVPLLIDYARLHAKEGQGRRAGLGFDRAGQRGNENPAGLGLPPGVHNRAALFADDAEIPMPLRALDWLTDCAEHPQARQ